MSRNRSIVALLRSRLPLLFVVLGLAAAMAAYVFGLPQIQAANAPFLEPSDLTIPRLVDLTVAVWCFWVGSSIGSFLNVVAWRMPRGESINGRSHCPRCQNTLKSRDNFPVFGWLMLAGRCRSCGLPISKRYPIVELVVGLCLLVVGIGQLYALSLPHQRAWIANGPLWAPQVSPVVLFVLFYHVFGITISFAFGLIRFDQHRLPSRLVAWGILPLVLAMIGYPVLTVVSWRMLGDVSSPKFTGVSWHIDAGMRVLTAIAAATIAARTLARGLCPAADPKQDPLGADTRRLMDLIGVIAVPAILVGWQSMLAILVICSLLAPLVNRFLRESTDRFGSFAITVPIVLSLHLFLWRLLHGFWWWPSEHSRPGVLIAWGVLLLIVPIGLRERRREMNSQDAGSLADEEREE